MRDVSRSSVSGACMRLFLAAVLLASLAVGTLGSAYAVAPASTDWAGAIAFANPVSGSISGPDERVYSIHLDANDLLSIKLDAAATYPDLRLELYSSGVIDGSSPEDAYRVADSDTINVADESIEYLVPSMGAGTYYIRVSTLTAGTTTFKISKVANAYPRTARLSGADRYLTSYAISRSSFTTASAVVIASGAGFPDALTAAGLAGALNAPVLLANNPTSTSDATLQTLGREIIRLEAKEAYIVGGTSVVNAVVRNYVAAQVGTVVPLSGSNRYKTSLLVAQKVATLAGPVRTAFVARGDNFADALAAAPIAYGQAIPILLTPSNALDPSSREFIDTKNVNDVIVVGGTGAVAPAVVNTLESLNSGACDVQRWAGANRYATSAVVASKAIDGRGWGSWKTIAIATGLAFPDALSGGAAMGVRGGPLLLTSPTALSSETRSAIANADTTPSQAIMLGGTAAVSNGVRTSVSSLLAP